MAEDYDQYQDDFYDQGHNDSFRSTRPEEEEDDQHKQKINGQIESLTQRIEELEQELMKERQGGLDIRKKYEEELKLAWSNQSAAEQKLSTNEHDEVGDLKKQLQKYKKKCEQLEEKLDIAMVTGNGGGEMVPLSLEREFHHHINNNPQLQEYKDRVLGPEDCIKILHSLKGGKKSKSVAMNDTNNDASSTTSGGGKLVSKIRALEEELKAASSAADDSDHLKSKIFQMSERIRIEKEHKRALDAELSQSKRKVEMLSDHVEKLVMHLKREGAHKVRLAEQLRISERDSQRIKEKADIIHKKSAAKDRLILELREGSKVLEDQLRLMDEKYLELRSKLDWARNIATKKIKKAEQTAKDLRVKFAMTGSTVLLDNLTLPTLNQSQSAPDGYENESFYTDYQNSGRNSPASGRRNVKNKSSSNLGASLESSGSMMTSKSNISMDKVLDKIRVQQGSKREWSEESIKKLTKSR